MWKYYHLTRTIVVNITNHRPKHKTIGARLKIYSHRHYHPLHIVVTARSFLSNLLLFLEIDSCPSMSSNQYRIILIPTIAGLTMTTIRPGLIFHPGRSCTKTIVSRFDQGSGPRFRQVIIQSILTVRACQRLDPPSASATQVAGTTNILRYQHRI